MKNFIRDKYLIKPLYFKQIINSKTNFCVSIRMEPSWLFAFGDLASSIHLILQTGVDEGFIEIIKIQRCKSTGIKTTPS